MCNLNRLSIVVLAAVALGAVSCNDRSTPASVPATQQTPDQGRATASSTPAAPAVPTLADAKQGPPPAKDTAEPRDHSVATNNPLFEEFSDRVTRYLKDRARAESKVPELKETSDPAKVSAREKALGIAIRAERPNAQRGDVFSDGASKEFRRIVEADFKSRKASDRSAVLVEVPMKTPPQINGEYPTTLPLATVPPMLLLSLPTLPDVLEYRFLGRNLILRDVKANLIVDYIPDAVPAAR